MPGRGGCVGNSLRDPERQLVRLLERHQFLRGHDLEIENLKRKIGLGQIVGESPAFLAAIRQIPIIAKYQTCVLLAGETGSGKEVFARAIHYSGVRSARHIIPINCGAVPVDLLENEFFGHQSGAFTSANCSRKGLINEADGGTLFLDEIDCLPPMAKVKLLRFLQDGHFRPLGSECSCAADVRVIAASNTHLPAAVESGRFRKDLSYRLNVVTLSLPPLRERGNDVLLLAQHFLTKYSAKLGAPAREFTPRALLKLACHSWPGNVRELENVVQRVIIVAGPDRVDAEDVHTTETQRPIKPQDFQHMKSRVIAEFEQNFIRQLLTAHGGHITIAARAAGKNRRAFWELMWKHEIGNKQPFASVRPR